MIKVSMSSKSTIKQHLPLFSSKFDSDFTSFKVTAKLAIAKGVKYAVDTNIPIRNLLANCSESYVDQLIVIELGISYEGG